MPNSPSTSFIPKQGPVKRAHKTATRQIQLLAVISCILFIATLITAGGLFLFNRHVDALLGDEVMTLNNAIVNFSDADMERVMAFNVRLLQTKERLSNSVSMVSLFESLEAATAKNIMIEDMKVERLNNEEITLAVKIKTDSFDSSLFQRGLLERNEMIGTVSVEELGLADKTNAEGELIEAGVSFVAKIAVPASAIPATVKVSDFPVVDTLVATTSPLQVPISTSTIINRQSEALPKTNETAI